MFIILIYPYLLTLLSLYSLSSFLSTTPCFLFLQRAFFPILRPHVFFIFSTIFLQLYITFLCSLHFSHTPPFTFSPSINLSSLYLLSFSLSLMHCHSFFSSLIFLSRQPPSPSLSSNTILGSLLTLFTFTRFSLYYLHSVSCILLPILTLLPSSFLLYLLPPPSRSFSLRILLSRTLAEPIRPSSSSVSRRSISLSRRPLLVSLRSTETE